MKQNVITIIQQSTAGSLDGTLSFPEVVGNLLSAGICFYHVDLIRFEKTCYSRDGESYVEALGVALQSVAEAFDASEIAAAVLSSQTEGQSFVEFVRRACLAGCVGYFAYLDGRKVTYLGRLGEEHVEFFPS
jgi:uncharacterized protein YbcV (DUF1398 family)